MEGLNTGFPSARWDKASLEVLKLSCQVQDAEANSNS